MSDVTDLPRRLERSPRPPVAGTVTRLPTRARLTPPDIISEIEKLRQLSRDAQSQAEDAEIKRLAEHKAHQALLNVQATAEAAGDPLWAIALFQSLADQIKRHFAK